jgi:hypothetical protein
MVKKMIRRAVQKTQKRPVVEDKNVAQEVLVYDVLTKQKVVAEFRGETKQWYSSKLHKVYHPVFEGGFRLVPHIIRFLGPAGEPELLN